MSQNMLSCHSNCLSGSLLQVKRFLTVIRDCGNGKDFFGDPFDVMFQNGNVISNNKSTCLYNPQGYLICVTICGPNQDFCNGPESSAAHITISTPVVLALGLLYLIILDSINA